MEDPKLVGVKDCGVFVITTVTLLANGGLSTTMHERAFIELF